MEDRKNLPWTAHKELVWKIEDATGEKVLGASTSYRTKAQIRELTLIAAAAPEMLEALKECSRVLKDGAPFGFARAWMMANEAIAKAEGK